MPSFRTGAVEEILSERTGLQRVLVDGERAYVLTELIGPVRVGDRVVVNTTAVDLGLGTGGWHVVHWNLARDELHQPGPGHIMKLRYTGLQLDTGSIEELDPASADSLEGLPVVATGLHSLVAPIAAAIAERRPGTRVAYVMTDDGALPLALSDLVHDLVRSGLVSTTISCGQAFGGAHEAVTVASGLVHARHRLDADVAVVAMGPGNVGTSTRLGTSALGQVPALDLAGRLGGRPILGLRASFADGRDRHRGISHHSLSVLELLGGAVRVPVATAWVERLAIDLETIDPRHEVVHVDAPGVLGALSVAGIELTSMGRPAGDDPCFVDLAAAAGAVAADLVP
ncbi:MAG: DUF3866 family protein [Actinomycetota bacterium]